MLKPVFSCPDPIRGGDNILVMSEVLLTDMTPHATNTRALLAPVAEKYAAQEPLFGIEQEYTFFKEGRPHGFPVRGFPAPQGFYYCGIGADEVFGRDVVEAHLDACLTAGLGISGINAEVMPGQWEFQVGPLGPLDVSDQLWVARWLLYRIAEDFGIAATLDPKPVSGDWNGAGAHTNFSTKAMREGYDPIIAACEALGKNAAEHVAQLRRRHRAAAHRFARDRAVERVQLRRVEPGRVGAHPVAGRGRQEGLHRGPPAERQHGPVRRDPAHHRDVLQRARLVTSKRFQRPGRRSVRRVDRGRRESPASRVSGRSSGAAAPSRARDPASGSGSKSSSSLKSSQQSRVRCAAIAPSAIGTTQLNTVNASGVSDRRADEVRERDAGERRRPDQRDRDVDAVEGRVVPTARADVRRV